MKTIITTSLIVFFVAVVLTAIVLIVSGRLEGQQVGVDRVEYYKLYFDALKAIWISFLVALLVALIPQGIAEIRYRFEKLKESRIAYSEAKTGVDYLAIRVCTLPLHEAAAHVQRVHVWKHQSQLYSELKQHLERSGYTITPEVWGEMMYDKLSAARELLEKEVHHWDDLMPSERLTLLLPMSPSGTKTHEGGGGDGQDARRVT